jgi:hypothetical protein
MTAKCSFAASAAAVALCFAGVVLAQSGPPLAAHSQVVMVHIKSDMLNEWMDLQKNELIPAQKKAGLATRTTYQTVFGNTNEFLTVTPLNKYAEFDGQSQLEHALGAVGAARLAAKLQKCLESRQVFISNSLPELSSAPAGQLPALGVFTRVRVATGRLEDYEALVKSEILPIYKKADVGLTVSRRGLGANANDVIQISWLSKMADIDLGSPITRALGPAGAAKLLAKTAGMATLVEQVVRRRVADLSY